LKGGEIVNMLFYTLEDDDQTKIMVHCTEQKKAEQAVSEVANGSGAIKVLDFIKLNGMAKSHRTGSAILILQKLLEIRGKSDDGSFISAMEHLLAEAANSGRNIADGKSKPH
jgi:hypothetical protein